MNSPAEGETRRFGRLRAVAALSGLFGSLAIMIGVLGNHGIVALGFLTAGGLSVGALGALVAVTLLGRQCPAAPMQCQAPKLLRWISSIFPVCEGSDLVRDVGSAIAEAPDAEKRRRYRRSYWRQLPGLFFMSWSHHMGCRCRCPGKPPRSRPTSPGVRPTDPPSWRLMWWRGLLLVVAGLVLIGALLTSSSRADGAVMVAITALILSRAWHTRY